ncbi:MAG: hypothetical protein R2836_01930 [Chitinophagales bacterium]
MGIEGAFVTKEKYDGTHTSTTNSNHNTSNAYNHNKKVNFSIDEIKSMTNTTSIQTDNLNNSSNSSNNISNKKTKKDSPSNEDSIIYMDTE